MMKKCTHRHTASSDMTLQMVVFVIMLTQSYRKYKGKGKGADWVTEWMYPLGAVH